MNKPQFNPSLIALAITLTLSAAAMAQGLSKDDYKIGQDKISADYKSAKVTCDALSGNPKDICMAQAKGGEKVAKAELEASYKPSAKTRNEIRVVKARANYAVAREQCDEMTGNAKDVCVKEAKAAAVAAKADAKSDMKTDNAIEIADRKIATAKGIAKEQTFEARLQASETSAHARKDAALDKRDADYDVAKEKCDAFSGDAKSKCLNDAKLRFGKI